MYENILPEFRVRECIKSWLMEDMPNFDIGAMAISSSNKEGVLMIKEQCILAGVPFINEVFSYLGCEIVWKIEEGTKIITVPCTIATIRGSLTQILQGERLALNILCRACGIATYAKKLSDIAASNKWKGSIVGTRKTTPGFRLVEKYAMIVGGAGPHRYDLSSMVMLKDNHIDASNLTDKEKAITQAVTQTRKVAGHHLKIEVESRNEKEAMASAAAGADIILLDNFNAKVACSVAQKLKSRYPRLLIEASGSINESNISGYMGSGIDILSTSRLCNGYPVIDVSMKIQDSDPSTILCRKEATLNTVHSGFKRVMPMASGGKTADNANVNKNGDSTIGALVDVDADVPEKRRRTNGEEDVEVEVEIDETPKQTVAKSESATSKSPLPSRSNPVAVKQSPSVAAPSQVSGKAVSQSPAQKVENQSTIRPSDTNKPAVAQNSAKATPANVSKPTTSPAAKVTAPSSMNKGIANRPPMSSAKNIQPGKTYGNQNTGNRTAGNQSYYQRTQQGGNRGQMQPNQYDRFNRQDNDNSRFRQNDKYQNTASSQSIQRPQPPQPVGRGIVGAMPGSAGPLHQQLALQAAANRAAGVPLRPGNTMGMGGRQGMNSNRGSVMGMGPGGRQVTGPNALPLDGHRGYSLMGRPKNQRDWEYRY